VSKTQAVVSFPKGNTMCFYNDNYDWTAAINELSGIRLEVPKRNCHECGRAILAGEWCEYIYQQENEECQICEDECSYYYNDEADKETCKHDYGEKYTGYICRECCLVLAAIYDREEREGCPEHSRQPSAGNLYYELQEDRDGVYVAHAIALFPELQSHLERLVR